MLVGVADMFLYKNATVLGTYPQSPVVGSMDMKLPKTTVKFALRIVIPVEILRVTKQEGSQEKSREERAIMVGTQAQYKS